MFNPDMNAMQPLPGSEASKFSASCQYNAPQGLMHSGTR
jgi:hypothetical protein